MSTKKAPAKKPASKNAKLDAAAKALRDLKKKEGASKPAVKAKPAPKAKAAPAKKPAPIVVAKKLEIVPEDRSAVAEIMERCVTLGGPQKLITGLNPDMTKSEVFAVFDALEQEGSLWQIRLGTFLMHAKNLASLGGAEKFEIAMAKSGRGISSVRKYLALVERTPMELLELPGIEYTAAQATVTIKDPEKKEKLFRDISAAYEKGDAYTVDEVKKEVAKIAPPAKPAANKKPPVVLSDAQKDILADFEKKITEAHILFQACEDMKFLIGAPKGDTEELRRMLGNFAKLNAKLEK